MKSKKIVLWFSIVVATVSLLVCFILFTLGGRFWFKDNIGKYNSLLSGQYASLNQESGEKIYVLPEQYYYFGHHDYDEWARSGSDRIPISNDRAVAKCFFNHNNQIYYLYYSHFQVIKDNHGGAFSFTWPDIFNSDTDKVAFSLWENPEGFFVGENCLYYAYGKNYYGARAFTIPIGHIADSLFFQYSNKKTTGMRG